MERKPVDEVKRTKRQVTNTLELPPSELLRLMLKHGATPVVEGMEAEGQRELVAANGASLPVAGSDHPCFAKMGILFGDSLDGVLREATLPLGWRLRPSVEHVMWTDLLDAQGRKRARIFYKAAFYDRHAELQPTVRYSAGIEYQGEFGKVGESHRGFVFDNATNAEVFSTKTLRREEKSDRTLLKTDALRKETAQWISEHFPEHADPSAYWG